MTTDTVSSSPPTEAPRRRRSRATSSDRLGVGIVALASVVISLLTTDPRPTGNAVVDALYVAAFVLLTVLAASRARRWSLLIAAGLVSLGSDGIMLAPSVGVLLLALWLAWRNQRHRVLGALVGGVVAWSALSLTWPDASGATAVLAAAAVIPVWVSGYRVARRPTRRLIRYGILAAAALVVIAVAVTALLAATQRSALQRAASGAADAASAIGAAEGSGSAGDELRESQQQFEQVAAAAGAWWTLPARAVPVLSQNLAAVRTAATWGAELTGVAHDLDAEVDYEQLLRDDGSVDLARLESFAPAIQGADLTVESAATDLAAADSPWILGPIATELAEFDGHLDRARGATAIAAAGVRDLPVLLGADRPRRYVLLLGNPAEARDVGGHVGNWAELVATDGHLDVVRVGEPYELFAPGRPATAPTDTDLPPSLLEMSPTTFPQNWGASPDMDAVAELVSLLYPQSEGGAPVDGVLYADPIGFAALLALTGPVEADGVRLSSDDAVAYLTKDQFSAEQGGGDRSLSDLVELALERLTGSRLPAPARIADAFAEVVERGHVQLATLDDSGAELLERTGLDRWIDTSAPGDALAVVNRNANPSKIDAYLRRDLDYEVDWNPDSGDVSSRVVVTLHNDAPAAGLTDVVIGSRRAVPPGTNRTDVAVLSPFDAVEARIEGQPVPFTRRRDLEGLHRYTVSVEVPPGQARTVVVELDGTVPPGRDYRLQWYSQPLLHPDEARFILRPRGSTFSNGSSEGVVAIEPRRVNDLTVRTES